MSEQSTERRASSCVVACLCINVSTHECMHECMLAYFVDLFVVWSMDANSYVCILNQPVRIRFECIACVG
jgi:hypothetical protein